jgi:hypothetical protein
MQNPGITANPPTTASRANPAITASRLPTKSPGITNGVPSSQTTRLIFHRSCGSESEGDKPTNKRPNHLRFGLLK